MLQLDSQIKWLVIEGILPMFGAAMLFLIWGIAHSLAQGRRPRYAWQESTIDSPGWLYGGLLIAIQAGLKCAASKPDQDALVLASCIGALAALFLLLAAMHERARNRRWRPPFSLKFSAFIVVILILIVGYKAQGIPKYDGKTSNCVSCKRLA
jgi:hypothetical protein